MHPKHVYKTTFAKTLCILTFRSCRGGAEGEPPRPAGGREPTASDMHKGGGARQGAAAGRAAGKAVRGGEGELAHRPTARDERT